jgi:aminopeptidase N
MICPATPLGRASLAALRSIAPLTTAVLVAASPAVAQFTPDLHSGGPLIPEQACYDVRSYALDLTVRPDDRLIEGTMTMRAGITEATDAIVLDLHREGRNGLDVDKISRGLQALHYEFDGARIRVQLGESVAPGTEIELVVSYGGSPRPAAFPPWDGGFSWKRTRDADGEAAWWIGTSCQGQGADLWWPCKDHPSDEPDTMDLRFTVPADLVCASNGTLASVVENPIEGDATPTKTWHWQVANPINIYCVTLNLGPYVVIERTYESIDGTEVPVFLWALPASERRARKQLDQFLEHLRFFEDTCGPYPFRNEKYGVVETPFLGMEHQTAIAYGNGYRNLQWNYDWLHHHELAHEWWGNLVSCADWKDMWIHEGIGTYMQALYIERKHGRKAYIAELRSKARGITNNHPVAPREATNSAQIYFGREGTEPDNDIYNKGALVMHTLRGLLGDEVFFLALRRMAYPDPAMEKVTDGSQCRHEDTEGIRAIAEKAAGGMDLEWFFEAMLRRAETPILSESRDGAELTLAWQTEAGVDFTMPVDIVIDGERRRVSFESDEPVTIRLPSVESTVAVDPDEWLMLLR